MVGVCSIEDLPADVVRLITTFLDLSSTLSLSLSSPYFKSLVYKDVYYGAKFPIQCVCDGNFGLFEYAVEVLRCPFESKITRPMSQALQFLENQTFDGFLSFFNCKYFLEIEYEASTTLFCHFVRDFTEAEIEAFFLDESKSKKVKDTLFSKYTWSLNTGFKIMVENKCLSLIKYALQVAHGKRRSPFSESGTEALRELHLVRWPLMGPGETEDLHKYETTVIYAVKSDSVEFMRFLIELYHRPISSAAIDALFLQLVHSLLGLHSLSQGMNTLKYGLDLIWKKPDVYKNIKRHYRPLRRTLAPLADDPLDFVTNNFSYSNVDALEFEIAHADELGATGSDLASETTRLFVSAILNVDWKVMKRLSVHAHRIDITKFGKIISETIHFLHFANQRNSFSSSNPKPMNAIRGSFSKMIHIILDEFPESYVSEFIKTLETVSEYTTSPLYSNVYLSVFALGDVDLISKILSFSPKLLNKEIINVLIMDMRGDMYFFSDDTVSKIEFFHRLKVPISFDRLKDLFVDLKGFNLALFFGNRSIYRFLKLAFEELGYRYNPEYAQNLFERYIADISPSGDFDFWHVALFHKNCERSKVEEIIRSIGYFAQSIGAKWTPELKRQMLGYTAKDANLTFIRKVLADFFASH